MARDNIPSDMGKYNKKSGSDAAKESARKKPAFAQKSYKERAQEAYDKYLGNLSKD